MNPHDSLCPGFRDVVRLVHQGVKVFDLNDYQRLALSAKEARSNAEHYGWKHQNGRDFCPLCISQGFMPPHGENDQAPRGTGTPQPDHPMQCSNGCGRIATHKHNAWYSYCSECACDTCFPFWTEGPTSD